MSKKLYAVIWEFQVKSESLSEFERVYGPNGLWAQLFRHNPEYLGTELLHDIGHRAGHLARYLTIDRWTSLDAFSQFKRDFAAEYGALDEKCERLTASETLLGEFEAVATS